MRNFIQIIGALIGWAVIVFTIYYVYTDIVYNDVACSLYTHGNGQTYQFCGSVPKLTSGGGSYYQ